ncbi:hypothetical protein B0H17DRAFT_1146807 [Mycena rosella]|uniref:Uncharacterized protein n=1 Tax=Mycena rosella TaxID=1033263 RepID=A0AAD7G0F2_MYCRO|nr:hypothetical protein B0H17DRAFT_1146807 [Mycena rosella]
MANYFLGTNECSSKENISCMEILHLQLERSRVRYVERTNGMLGHVIDFSATKVASTMSIPSWRKRNEASVSSLWVELQPDFVGPSSHWTRLVGKVQRNNPWRDSVRNILASKHKAWSRERAFAELTTYKRTSSSRTGFERRVQPKAAAEGGVSSRTTRSIIAEPLPSCLHHAVGPAASGGTTQWAQRRVKSSTQWVPAASGKGGPQGSPPRKISIQNS